MGWGCAGDGPAPRLSGDDQTLRLAIPSDINSLDPAEAYDVVSWPLVRTMFHGLVDYDDHLDLIPWQSESWSISEDGRVLTFTLRPGIRFSNGRFVTAEDYVYTLTRILDPATRSPGQWLFRNIEGAGVFQDGKADRVKGLSAPDARTFRIELIQPDLTFLHVLAMPFAYPVPKEEVAKHPQDFFAHPVGTGPFVLEKWQRGTYLRFEPNPSFTGADTKLRSIDVRVGGDETLHMMMFERGEIDIASITATGIPAPDFVRVMKDPVLSRQVESQPLNATYYLSLNTEMPPFDDVRVRRALNHAIDRERIVRLISDRGIVAKGVLPPGMPGFKTDRTGYAYDPPKARALLAEAGFPTGFETELQMVAQNDTESKIAQVVQQDLEKIGIKTGLKPVTGATRIETLGRRRTVPFGTFAWYQDYPDPSNFLDVLFNGERITEVNSNNVAFYDNPQVNALLRQAAHSTDMTARLELYRQAEDLIVDDAPWVFLYHPKMYILRQPWLKGLKLNPVWPFRFERMWIE
ncbi:MAG: ABC transporter substrate-binding protein [candidate division Zixibacteria bacterium]|nr:ABC transporter substrate-binding protein [candidate division Zixibacteria bacterium]